MKSRGASMFSLDYEMRNILFYYLQRGAKRIEILNTENARTSREGAASTENRFSLTKKFL